MPPPPSNRPPRTVSNPGALKAVSAARAQPAGPAGPKLSKDALKAGAANTALNAFGVLRDTWEDFRNSDRFFKYKAGVLATWVALSIATFVVACPGGTGPSNSIGARIDSIPPAVASEQPVYFVKNDSAKPWTDVVIVVNDTYRMAVASVTPNGQVTLSTSQLLGADGKVAPRDLRVTSVEVRTARGDTELMRDGVIR